MTQQFTVKELQGKFNISVDTWKRNKDKKELLAKYGVEVISIEKQGRSFVYTVDTTKSEEKKALEEIMEMSIDARDLDALHYCLGIWFNNIIRTNKELVDETGATEYKVKAWKAQLTKLGVFDGKDSAAGKWFTYEGKNKQEATEEEVEVFLGLLKEMLYPQALSAFRIKTGKYIQKVSPVQVNALSDTTQKIIGGK